ncbi:MAG: 3-deoxy-D-manno-octulosonic acid transferase [Planctomycetota bacterium]
MTVLVSEAHVSPRISFPRRVAHRLLSYAVDLVYLLLLVGLVPWLLYLVLVRRRGIGKLSERLGFPDLEIPQQPRIWIHAVSVGELEAAQPLLTALRERRPDVELVISTTTTTAQKLAKSRYAHHAVFLFPFDLGFCVRRSLARVRPQMLILMELELWPNLILNTYSQGVPVLIANGRISEGGFKRMWTFRRWLGPFLRCVRRYLVQNDEYRARLERLGVPDRRLQVTGNLKLDRAPLEKTDQIRGAFNKQWGYPEKVLRWIAGCTHDGEEPLILEAHRALREQFPGLFLILAPRYVERCPELARLARKAGFSVALTSEGPITGSPAPDVLLVDEVGKLANLYACADVAFVGGSLVPRGGHNILEPALASTPALHGPYTANFREMVELLTGGGATLEVTAETLEKNLAAWLADPEQRRSRVQHGLQLLTHHRGVAERSVREIVSLLGS